MAELHEKESWGVKRKDSQLWGRAAGQEDGGGGERNEEEEEEEVGDGEARVGVDDGPRWGNLPGLRPACDER